MYEKPQMFEIGNAQTVVRGISAMGYDPDGQDFPGPFEFLDDPTESLDSE